MAEIPVLKERRMFGYDQTTGEESSNFINDSYAGILRLSPNSSATLLEDNTWISLDATTEKYMNFDDAINSYIENQFVRVSTSDGVLVDMRISSDAVEYNNLYVIGAMKVSGGITVYSNDNNIFMLDNIKLPTKYNNYNISISNNSQYEYIPLDNENIEESYILVNTKENSATGEFEFRNATDYINGFVKDSILKLNTLPTGSIHFIPVNLKQYKILLLKNRNSEHNKSDLETEPLIRDFLLCDGSVYNNSDFPELAKILNYEKINYWKPDGNNMRLVKDADAVDTLSHTFRVPDLRSMFIQSIIPLLEYANESNNKVGSYEIDSDIHPNMSVFEGGDNHYHYLVLDNGFGSKTNTASIEYVNQESSPNYRPSVLYGSEPACGKNGFLLRSEYARPLAKYGSMIQGCGGAIFAGSSETASDGNCDRKQLTGNTLVSSYIYRPSFGNLLHRLAGPTCGYILSAGRTSYKINDSNPAPATLDKYLGASSTPIDMSIELTKSNSIDNNINYTSNRTIYTSLSNKYANYTSGDTYRMLNHENSPEFFAVLPLIKI